MHGTNKILILIAFLMFPTMVQAADPVPISAQDIPKQKAADILPANLLTATNYRIDPVVTNDGKNDIFVLSSNYGHFVAEGRQELARRISEINAIVALDKIEKGEKFADALVKAGKAPFEAAWSLVTEPVDTVTGVVKGVGTAFKRLGGMITQDRGDLEDSKMKEILGVSAVKRNYATKLNVDVYSSNEALQEHLNSVAWAVFAGGLTTKIAFSLPENDDVVMALRVAAGVKTLNSLIENSTPEDLRSLNKGKMERMQVPADLINQFLGHNSYSPRHQTTIVAALESLPKTQNRKEFFARAIKAKNEREAFIYQYGAEMLVEYNQNTAKINEIVGFGRTVLAYDNKSNIVAVIPYEHPYYTNSTANGISRLTKAMNDSVPTLGKVAVFIDVVSPNVEKWLVDHGWTVTQLRKFALR
jgi:hypothetical protein